MCNNYEKIEFYTSTLTAVLVTQKPCNSSPTRQFTDKSLLFLLCGPGMGQGRRLVLFIAGCFVPRGGGGDLIFSYILRFGS